MVRLQPGRDVVALRLEPHHAAICAEVAARPSATVAELRAWAARTHAATVGHAAMWRTLSRLGLTRKKSRSARPSRTVTT